MRPVPIALTSSTLLAVLIIYFCSNCQTNRNSLRKEDGRNQFSFPPVLNISFSNDLSDNSQQLRLLRAGKIDIDQLLEDFSREFPEYVNKTPDYFQTESVSPTPSSLNVTIQPSAVSQDSNATLATLAPVTVVSTSPPTTVPPQSTGAPTTLAPQGTLLPTTPVPQTLMPTTLIPQTLLPTTLTPLSIVPTTLTPQTIVPTTLLPQTTLPPTTLTPYSLMPTTVIPQTVLPITVIPVTVFPTTILPTTLVPIASRQGIERHRIEIPPH